MLIQGPGLTVLLTLLLYVLPMICVFVYAFFLLCNIDYPEEEVDKTDNGICPSCHNRKRSDRWREYAKIGELMMTPQNMPKKAVYYPRRLSQKFRRASTGSKRESNSEGEDQFSNIRQMIRDIHAQKRSSGMSVETNPEDRERELHEALSSGSFNLPTSRRQSMEFQGGRRQSILADMRRPSNIFAIEEQEDGSEGWLSSVVTPIAQDFYEEEDETDHSTHDHSASRKRAPPPTKINIDLPTITLEGGTDSVEIA